MPHPILSAARLQRRCRALLAGVASVALLLLPSTPLAAQAPAAVTKGSWSDARLSPDVRARAAVAAMTIDEKISLLSTPMTILMGKATPPNIPLSIGTMLGVPRFGIPPVPETDASLGVSNLGEMRKGDVATSLPSSLALGASWNPELAFRGGAMIGREARAKGFGIMMAGGANLVRDPRAGRSFEYVSEDPYLTGLVSGQTIAGVQSNRMVSTVKHFALNDLEAGRNVYNVVMPEAAMRESDLLAFQIAIETGKPGSVMCGYNRVNSTYACENAFLLTDVLRRDWGYDGFVMSDWGSVHSVGALAAGLDQQSGYQVDAKHFFGGELKKAVAAGQVPMGAVDRAATRILRALYAKGVIDTPPAMGGAIDYEADARVAQAQAEAGMVLLRNEGGILPIAAGAKRIAVIGGHADVGVLIGGGSSQVAPVGGVKLAIAQKGGGILDSIKRAYGGTAPLAALKAQFPQAQIDYADGADRAAAAGLAARADIAIVFAEKWFTEAKDSPDIALGDGQDELIAAVATANPKTVVVLETGNAVAMPWNDRVAAILVAWYPGQRGAEAIARTLSGAVNPGGHLPVTFPVSADQLPLPKLPSAGVPAPAKGDSNFGILADKIPFTYSHPEGANVGYRWFAATGKVPLYAFGHGLSYTSFGHDRLTVRGGATITAAFDVRNSGQRAGIDVAQLYVTAPGRAKRLAGWGRAELQPGGRQRFTVTVDPRLLADYDVKARQWVVPAGTYRVELGTSATATSLSRNVQLKRRAFADAGRPTGGADIASPADRSNASRESDMNKLTTTAAAAMIAAAVPAAATAQAAAPATAAAPAFSTETSIGDLLDNPAAKAVLQKHVPDLVASEQISMARGMTLPQVQQYSPTVITDALLAKINADLAKIPAATGTTPK